jgi:fimbrial chaperone protein
MPSIPCHNRVAPVLLIGLVLSGILGGVPAGAGELKLSTVRIDLDDSRSNFALTVTNVGATDSLVQFRVMAWNQDGGQDNLTVAREMIANPPLVEIPSGAPQVVRIGFNGKKQQALEGCYRLLVEEVPKQDRERGQTIETYLKLSVPVFVAPLPGAPAAVPPTASIGPGAEGKPALLIHNPDPRHLRITGYRLVDGSDREGKHHTGLFYVLPGATMGLPLDAGDPGPATARRAILDGDPLSPPLRISLGP